MAIDSRARARKAPLSPLIPSPDHLPAPLAVAAPKDAKNRWGLTAGLGRGLTDGLTPVIYCSNTIVLVTDAAFSRVNRMAEGTIKRLTDKGFGFIETGTGQDLFFHMSAVEGVRFEDLQQGQKVSFKEGQGPKGPRAENVKPI